MFRGGKQSARFAFLEVLLLGVHHLSTSAHLRSHPDELLLSSNRIYVLLM